MRNNTYLRLENVYKMYQGYVGTKELMAEGFSNRQIAMLAEEAYLEKVCHGYYWLGVGRYRKPQDYKCIEVCLSNPRAVICMDSAIYYQDGLSEEPEYLSVATERCDRSLLKLNFPIKRHYFSSSHFKVGIQERNTEFGSYRIYDVERSICDILRLEENVRIDIMDYAQGDKRQRERVLEYAKMLRVSQSLLMKSKIPPPAAT